MSIIVQPPSGANADLAAALGVLDGLSGPDAGGNYRRVCPACGNRADNPSLSVKREGGRLLFKCFRDCTPQVIEAAIKARQAGGVAARQNTPIKVSRRALSKDAMFAYAMRIWLEAMSAVGTPVERYLRSRAINFIPLTIKYHPGLKHPTGGYFPAMIAIVVDSNGHPIGVHRTFLTSTGRKASVEPVKMSLGGVSGGAVRLLTPKSPFVPAKLAIAEGLETGLSVMQMNRGLSVWAALSTSGLCNVALPAAVKEVIVCADGDAAGDKAARTLKRRLEYERRAVRIARAPRGKDFNDLLCSKEKVRV